MRAVKRRVVVALLVLAVAALAAPMERLSSRSAYPVSGSPAKLTHDTSDSPEPSPNSISTQIAGDDASQQTSKGDISPQTFHALGLSRTVNVKAASERIARELQKSDDTRSGGGEVAIQSGQPESLDARSALSDALIIALGGRDNQFSEVALIADWDGREDCTADREQKVDDFSLAEGELDVELTRTAISEHTVANGFNQNVYYYGDSVGNLWIGVDTNPGLPGGTGVGGGPTGFGPQVKNVISQISIPVLVKSGAIGTGGGGPFPVGVVTLVSPGGAAVGGSTLQTTVIPGVASGDCLDDQVVVTGIAVNPVADLGDFGAPFCGVIGEVVYVSVLDTEGCTKNSSGNPLRTRIFAFGFRDGPNGVGGAGVTSVGAIQILRSKFSNIAGIAVDDDGSLYYQLVDLIQLTGGALFKATEICATIAGDACRATPRINRVITAIPDPPTLNSWVGSSTNPVVTASAVRNTNYGGGSSTLFGDIIAITSGPCNVLYAAVSRSFVAGDVSFEQLTEGLFPAPSQFGAAGTPSMVISFADCSGAFDPCTGNALIPVTPPDPNVGDILPEADGFADVANAGVGARIPGVNNFRVFVQGNGPAIANTNPVIGLAATATPLKVDMQIDYVPAHSGIAVSGEGTVFVISGGAPAGVGKSPSPMVGEILCFEDICPADRRADFVDLRGDQVPNPPASGGGTGGPGGTLGGTGSVNVGDGDSDRFDHIFYQAPLDQNTLTVAGLSGLNFGFLRYTNRLAPNAISPGGTLGVTGGQTVLGDTGSGFATAGVIFEWLDPGHQVAGGDDQNTPFRGDDDNGLGFPAIPAVPNSSATGTLLNGGFEFLFNGFVPPATPTCIWNGFFWNANGNITFGLGDTSPFVNVPAFRQGPTKIAPAWAKLDPDARTENLCAFPVMAVGFVNVNAFKIRWINVPEEGFEGCTGTNVAPGNSSNTFSVTLYDDGTGIDENANQLQDPKNPTGNNSVPFDLLEGPTDLRFTPVTLVGGGTVLAGCSPRPEGSGIFVFEYCRMDLLGTAARPVLTGFSIGGLNPLNPPGLCEINLSKAQGEALIAFGVLPSSNNETAAIGCNCCIGEGTEPTLFELFNEGKDAAIGAGGEITFATPDFDLRFEGNDAALCTALRQKDANRGRLCFRGIGCAPPAPEICIAPVPAPFVTTPGTTGVVNAICQVTLNIVGCGFFPNEVTTICQGFEAETGQPLSRPGKTVTTAATLQCDTNGDGVPDSTIFVLSNVTPVNCNLVTAVISPLASMPGTGFDAFCCGGVATVTVKTTFASADNNIFTDLNSKGQTIGAFTLTSTCLIDLGVRAPLVFSVTPSKGDCAPCQDLLVSGACFCGPDGIFNVTSVIFQDTSNPANEITIGLNPSASGQIKPLTCNLFDVFACFTSANAGKTFLVFAVGPGGTSRNLTGAITGQPGAPCPTVGNEQGFQLAFACSGQATACPPGVPLPGCPCPTGVPDGTNGCVETPVDLALVNGCKLDRDADGNFVLDVLGKNLKAGAVVKVGSITPKHIKFREPDPSFPGAFLRMTLRGRICQGLPGVIIVTNPSPAPGVPVAPSQPFPCTESCATN